MAKEEITKAFQPDFNDELFEVVITVYKNGTVRQMHVKKADYNPSYHEIIGAIEVIKASFLRDVGEAVNEAYAKHKAGGGGSDHGG